MDALRIDSSSGGRVVALPPMRLYIGRADDNDLILDDKTVSRKHAVLERQGGKWRLRDLRSRNFTFVNGIKVSTAAVTEGDVLTLGAVTMRLALGLSPEALAAETADINDVPQGDPGLTPRQKDVVRRVGMGYSNAQIAEDLMITESAVDGHLERIREKTGSRRRPDLTLLAVRLGLIT